MAATDLSPNVDNYMIGKGGVWFRPLVSGTLGAWRHVGNVPEFEFENSVERLAHYSSMAGIRSKDLDVIIEQSATIRILLEEFSGPNLAMYLLGEQTGADETAAISIGTATNILGQVAFAANNTIGPNWNLWLPSVSFAPSAPFAPISEEWAQFEVTGEVSLTEGRFGIASRAPIAEATLPLWA